MDAWYNLELHKEPLFSKDSSLSPVSVGTILRGWDYIGLDILKVSNRIKIFLIQLLTQKKKKRRKQNDCMKLCTTFKIQGRTWDKARILNSVMVWKSLLFKARFPLDTSVPAYFISSLTIFWISKRVQSEVKDVYTSELHLYGL